MGNQISNNPDHYLSKYYSQLSYQKEIPNTTFVQTFMCKSQDQGYVIGKVIRLPEDAQNLKPQSIFYINEEKLADCPNLLPLYIDEIQPDGYPNFYIGFRQYVYHSLLEKLRKKIPRMSVIEKHWLTFQLIAALNQLHRNEKYHGDIKPENILLTSYNHLFITDMVNYKPIYVSIDDLKTFKTYFGELDNTSRCYFAPERLVKKEEIEQKQKESIQQDDGISMDIFSVGCVIAEIHMEGEVLFSRSKLVMYKDMQLNPRTILDQKINHKPTVDLIMKMIDLNPKNRPTVSGCLDELTQEIAPHSFCRSLFQLNSALTKSNFLFSDLRIGLIRKYMPSIYRACFDKKKSTAEIQSLFFEPLERTIFEQLREDGLQKYNETLVPSSEKYEFIGLQGDYGDEQNQELNDIEKAPFKGLNHLKESPESSIIVIHWIGQFISTCFFPQSRRVALELFLVIAKATSLEIRLQYILPYVFTMFNDPQQKVAAKAVEVSIKMFESLVDENEEDSQFHYLNSTDYNVFKGYIMKEFKQLSEKFKESKIVQLTYLRYLPLLAKIGYRFTEISAASRLKKQAINPKVNLQGQIIEGQNEQAAPQFDEQLNQNSIQNIEGQIPAEDNQIPMMKIESVQNVQNEDKQPNESQNFSTTGVANFDKEIEELRKSFQKEIQEQIAKQDPSTQRLIYSKLGYLCDFFGSRMTIDFINLQVTSALNSKEILVKLDSLQSFLGIAIKTGKQTAFEEILKIFLNDSEEIILIETIRILNVLLRLGLIKKDNLLDEFVKKQNQNKGNQTFLQILLPLLMHPNQWIRDEILQFIKTLSDFKREKSFLSKTDVICLLRRLIKQYLNDESQSLNFILEASTQDSSIQKMGEFLKKPLSRNYYEFMKRQSQLPKSNNQAGQVQLNMIELNNEDDTLKMSSSDKIALEKFKERLGDISENFAKQQQVFILPGRSQLPAGVYQHSISQYRAQPSAFWKKLKLYNTYRVVQYNTLDNLINQYQNQGVSIKDLSNNLEQIQNQQNLKVHNSFFEICNRIQGDKELNPFDTNNGICKAIKTDPNERYTEIDYLMDQLELQEDFKVLKVESQLKDLFNRISNQSLPVEWLLQIEKLSDTIPQPTNLPYFSQKISETTSVPIPKTKEASQFAQSISLGDMRTSLENFRPKGRLLTTLYEHNNPVTSLAISEDQTTFLTASRDDKQVKIWKTSDILRDSTSHSRNTITTDEKINQITMIQNSEYVAVAQNKGHIDIYRIDRLPFENQDQQRRLESSNPEQSYQQNINKNENDGDILHCLSSILPVSQQHLLFSSSQKGSIFINDLRAPNPVVVNHGAIQQSRGMITCMELGQDPYQILCGTIGGYVLVYDVRFNMISTQYKHSQRSPINSLAIFKPSEKREFQQWTENEISKFYNMSNYQSPMVMVATGGSSYELSLINLDTGVLEILMAVNEDKDSDILNQGSQTGCGVQIPSYLRECLIRDAYSYPEKTETNQSLFRRYMNQAKGSLTSTSQIKLTQNLDDELFKASKLRYHLLNKASTSENACRKIIIPRKATSMLLSTQTVDYCITGGNDKRLRYWSLREPASLSYYINTPKSDECQYMSSAQSGGTLYIREQILKTETFPRVIANMFQPFTQKTDTKNKQIIRDGKIVLGDKENEIELAGDSPYYRVLANIIQSQSSQDSQVIYNSKTSGIGVSGMVLGYTTSGVTSSSGNQYQIEMRGAQQKPTVFNLNGLSEWQHFNGVNLTEGNAIINNNTYSDKWSSSSSAGAAAAGMLSGQYQPNSYKRSRRDSLFDKNQQSRQARHRGSSMNGEIYDNSPQITRDYMYQDTLFASHSDSILDLGVLELDPSCLTSQSYGDYAKIDTSYLQSSKMPILISCGRDGQVKLWQ